MACPIQPQTAHVPTQNVMDTPCSLVSLTAKNRGKLPSYILYWSYEAEKYFLLKLTNDTSFLNDMLFSLFQKTSFHGISAYVYFAI